MTRTAKLLGSAFTALAMAGCAQVGGGDLVYADFVSPSYQPNAASVFAARGETVIVGSTRDNASPEEIAAALRLPARFAHRTVRAAATAQTGPHVVLVFAPSGGTTPNKACSGLATGGVAGDPLKVLGVFCSSYGSAMTEAVYSANGSPVPSDPDFSQRFSVLLNMIMPIRNSEFEPGCRGKGC